MLKNADTGGSYYDWEIFDNKRDPFNRGDDNDSNGRNELYANSNVAEKLWWWNRMEYIRFSCYWF